MDRSFLYQFKWWNMLSFFATVRWIPSLGSLAQILGWYKLALLYQISGITLIYDSWGSGNFCAVFTMHWGPALKRFPRVDYFILCFFSHWDNEFCAIHFVQSIFSIIMYRALFFLSFILCPFLWISCNCFCHLCVYSPFSAVYSVSKRMFSHSGAGRDFTNSSQALIVYPADDFFCIIA